MDDPINDLAAKALDDYPGGSVYRYNALDALSARVLVVEQGGKAFPHGDDIGAPSDDKTGKWASILDEAGLVPGTYSWWNAIPVGLDRPDTVQDKAKAPGYVRKVIALHQQLFVVVAVGATAQDAVRKAVSGRIKVVAVRSPLRASGALRDDIRDAFADARAYAYPAGFERSSP